MHIFEPEDPDYSDFEIRFITSGSRLGREAGEDRMLLARAFRVLRKNFPFRERCFVLPLYGRLFNCPADPPFQVFVVEVRFEGKTIGIGTAQGALRPSPVALLTFVWVDPAFRKRGVARLITTVRKRLLEELGIAVIFAEVEAVDRGAKITEDKLRRITAFHSQYWSPVVSGAPFAHADPWTGVPYNLLLLGSERPELSREYLEQYIFTLYRSHYGVNAPASKAYASRVRAGNLEWVRPLDLLRFKA